MKQVIPIPDGERGSNYTVAGETWCECFKRVAFAKRFAVALAKETGKIESVKRECDDMIWRTNTKEWGNC